MNRLLLGLALACGVGVLIAAAWSLHSQWRSPSLPADVPTALEPSAVRPSPLREAAWPLPDARSAGLAPLNATLLGTVIGRHPMSHRAVVEEGHLATRRFLMIGEPLQGRLLTAIERGFIRLRRPDGEEERLTLDNAHHADALIQTVGPDRYRVDRQRLLEAIRGDMNRLRAQVQLQPALEQFQLVGLRVSGVQPKSLVAQAGLQDGDVIRFVNDTALESLPALLAAYYAARTEQELSLGIQRKGAPRTLRYVVR